MNRRKEERYQRGVAHISPERKAKTVQAAMAELGFKEYPTAVEDIAKLDSLVAHKLGIRQPKETI